MTKRIVAVDLFCGAGGTSTGLARSCESLGYKLDLTAVNHWPIAIETHAKNHPTARHLCHSLDDVNPRETIGRRLDLLMASPECTHHSIARGGTPVNDQSRSTAWHVVRWAEALRPKAILVENVREFREWGPVGVNGRPVKRLQGETFRAWVKSLESLGYTVGATVLNAADYGDPTTRQRLFVMAVLSRRQLPWPKQSHARDGGKGGLFGQLKHWRPAREIIDWSISGTSIFNRKRPLSPNTMKRIEAGLVKFKWPEPFLVILRNNMGGRSVDDPIPTVAAGGQHVGLCEPFVMRASNSSSHTNGRNTSINDPVGTIHAGGPRGKARHPGNVDNPLATVINENHTGLVEPFIMHTTHHGADRVMSLDDQAPTITGANRGELAFIVPQFGGASPRATDRPLGAVTTTSRGVGMCEGFILPHRQFDGMQVDDVGQPLRTITAKNGGCNGLVQPFLVPYYGTGTADGIADPLRSVTTKDRLGVVEPVQLDIRFRMLQPHELAAAQGFPADYKFAGNRSEQVKQIGNAVPVNVAAALTQAMLVA